MKTIALLCILLSGCTMVSKHVDPRLGYRNTPRVYLKEHDSWWSLEKACISLTKIPDIHLGCATVPIDPKGTCTVHVMKGDREALAHELWHCHGYRDTMLPWNAKQYTHNINLIDEKTGERIEK